MLTFDEAMKEIGNNPAIEAEKIKEFSSDYCSNLDLFDFCTVAERNFLEEMALSQSLFEMHESVVKLILVSFKLGLSIGMKMERNS